MNWAWKIPMSLFLSYTEKHSGNSPLPICQRLKMVTSSFIILISRTYDFFVHFPWHLDKTSDKVLASEVSVEEISSKYIQA